MRTIKFRFWYKPLKSMHSWENMQDQWVMHDDDLDIFKETEDWKPMQFTGLLDKNGKEIYEGDIMNFNAVSEIGYVVYQEHIGAFKIKTDDTWYYVHEANEIIGNIWENSDLLNP